MPDSREVQVTIPAFTDFIHTITPTAGMRITGVSNHMANGTSVNFLGWRLDTNGNAVIRARSTGFNGINAKFMVSESSQSDVQWRNVKDYGAKGDGATDDTAAFAAAIASLPQNPLTGVIYIPEGTYRVAQINIEHSRSLHIVGDGGPNGGFGSATRLETIGDGSFIQASASQGTVIKGLYIVNLGGVTSGEALIDFGRKEPGAYATQWTVEDCMLHGNGGSGMAINAIDSFTGRVTDCHIVFNHTGIQLVPDAGGYVANGIYIGPRNLFQAQSSIHIRGIGAGVSIVGNTFQQLANNKAGVLTSNSNQANEGLEMHGNWMGDNTDVSDLQPHIKLYCKGANITGNMIGILGVDLLAGCEGIRINGNRIFTGGSFGIRKDAITSYNITSNSYAGNNGVVATGSGNTNLTDNL